VNAFVQGAYEVMDGNDVNVERAKAGLLPANIALPRGVGTAVDPGALLPQV